MQRALFSSLTRPLVTRQAVRSARVMRPVAIAPRMVRFASDNAQKPAEGEAAKEAEAASEASQAESEANEAPKEVDPVEEVKQQLVQKDKEYAEMKNHYARAIADFRNLQESTKKEVQKAKDFALQKFAKDLLESVDNFDLALNAVKEENLDSNKEMKNLYEGVNMTRNVFEKTLARHGIEKIDPIGQPFDPNQHEAAFEVPQPDKEPGTVFHVQQTGYTLNSRVLRPAKVGIVKDAN